MKTLFHSVVTAEIPARTLEKQWRFELNKTILIDLLTDDEQEGMDSFVYYVNDLLLSMRTNPKEYDRIHSNATMILKCAVYDCTGDQCDRIDRTDRFYQYYNLLTACIPNVPIIA